jgi:hypothetical protein
MPVEHLDQAHLDHLPDEQGYIVAPLCDNHQVALPQDLLRLLRQLHSHGTLLPQAQSECTTLAHYSPRVHVRHSMFQ